MTDEQKMPAYQAMLNTQKNHITTLEQKLARLEEENIDLEAHLRKLEEENLNLEVHLHKFEREHYILSAYREQLITEGCAAELLGWTVEELHSRLDQKAAQGLRYVQQERQKPLSPVNMELELVDEDGLDRHEGSW